MKVLVCGGRDYADEEHLTAVLDRLYAADPEMCIIHGGAPGADTMAGQWAKERGLPVLQCDANWVYYGKAAGPIRNQWMLQYGQPDLVVAFPGGRGTADMVTRAKLAGIANLLQEGK